LIWSWDSFQREKPSFFQEFSFHQSPSLSEKRIKQIFEEVDALCANLVSHSDYVENEEEVNRGDHVSPRDVYFV
jgi:hypothetical protein